MMIFLCPIYKQVKFINDKGEEEEKNVATGEYQIMTKFTAKGIPHPKKNYPAFGNFHCSKAKFSKAKDIYHHMNQRESTSHHFEGVNLKEQFFIRLDRKKIMTPQQKVTCHETLSTIKDRLDWNDMVGILTSSCKVIAHYGGMSRKLKLEHEVDQIGISIDYNRRTVSEELWWEKGVRIFPDSTGNDLLSVPHGHVLENTCINFDSVPLSIQPIVF